MADKSKPDTSLSRYVASIVVALLFFAIFLLSFPAADSEISNPVDSEPFVVLVDNNDGIDIVDLSDFAPLFIPTRWNYASKRPIIPEPRGWDVALPNVKKPAAALSDPKFIGDILSEKRVENVVLRTPFARNFFRDFGRKESKASPKKQNGITFALVNLADGKTFVTKNIADFDSSAMISIAEFMVSVENDGWAIRPLAFQTSGDEKTDTRLLSLLTPLRLLKGVPSGDYKAQFIP